MRDRDRIVELRKNMIDDWKYRGLDWRQIPCLYSLSYLVENIAVTTKIGYLRR
jgi:hypothetical protein